VGEPRAGSNERPGCPREGRIKTQPLEGFCCAANT
jgi:hypothetical protein